MRILLGRFKLGRVLAAEKLVSAEKNMPGGFCARGCFCICQVECAETRLKGSTCMNLSRRTCTKRLRGVRPMYLPSNVCGNAAMGWRLPESAEKNVHPACARCAAFVLVEKNARRGGSCRFFSAGTLACQQSRCPLPPTPPIMHRRGGRSRGFAPTRSHPQGKRARPSLTLIKSKCRFIRFFDLHCISQRGWVLFTAALKDGVPGPRARASKRRHVP